MFTYINKIIRQFGGKKNGEIDPNQIFLDSKNLPDFDTYQFEGRLQKPISKKIFTFIYSFCFIIFFIFIFKLFSLQIVNGSKYKERSENNKMKQTLVLAPRGIIVSRNGEILVSNELDTVSKIPKRRYIEKEGFGTLLGFVKYPGKDKSGYYYEEDFSAKDGAELYFNEILTGKNGIELVETSVDGLVVSENIVSKPKNGLNVTLSIDSRIQNKLFSTIKDLALRVGFEGGAGIIMDVNSGEILSLVSYPEYDSNIMTNGTDIQKINSYFKDKNNPFIDRVISGLYTPGSIVKPFVAFGALEEKIINPEKQIMSTGELVIPNPYNKAKPTIFKDWKAHGLVDMRSAIAVSSDVYFYQIGGGFENQKGLGIEKLKKYLENFGFSYKTGFDEDKEETGVIPDPKWKEERFGGEIWRVGDTYNTSIGQYGMQITPIQAVVATASLANNGFVVTPSLLFTSTTTKSFNRKIKGEDGSFEVAKEGMRMSVTSGTAGGLNVPFVSIAAKTGTAELGAKKQFVNSWVIGFFPYENPKYAFAVVMEKGPVANLTGGVYVMRTLLDWMNQNTPEYFN